MIDYKKVGEAALMADYAQHCAGGGRLLVTDEAVAARHEAIGKAAVAAMIPALLPLGLCNSECPFDKPNKLVKGRCLLGCQRRGDVAGKDCPAYKGGSDESRG